MALSERFFREQPRAWDLFAPLVDKRQAPAGFDPAVGQAVYEHYRQTEREADAEKASGAIAHYLYAAHAAERLGKTGPAEALEVAYDLTGFFLHTGGALDSIAEWLAAIYEMLLPRNARPSLVNEDFVARFALIDVNAQQLLKEQRAWMEEALAYRWHAGARNGILWKADEGEAVVSSIGVRGGEAAALGTQKERRAPARRARELTKDYLARLGVVLATMFRVGAGKLPEKKAD